ncbi:hypothetical protein HB364_26980 [Pseudoflavitalea sp. X16]|uniref:hypothetical protein n=1 Tax=Paraflavitalea devenefica TaxID=2716334 RepID=UPI0014219B2B|nr:hypothetical protein [Paraflavitalea devenefica]NII28755.1 hypothetical protein [Paraflavitalea devenefica]
MIKLLTSISLMAALLSCTNNDRKENTPSTKDSIAVVGANKSVDSLTPDGYFSIGKDSILISPFEIAVSLSPRAEERIKQGKETIIVHVFFTGTPRDSSGAELEEDGSFHVAATKKEIVYGQVARFDNVRFSHKIYDQLADKDIELGVNVYSGRKSSPDNLLNCESLFDKISHVAHKRFTLEGKLIYGDD